MICFGELLYVCYVDMVGLGSGVFVDVVMDEVYLNEVVVVFVGGDVGFFVEVLVRFYGGIGYW